MLSFFHKSTGKQPLLITDTSSGLENPFENLKMVRKNPMLFLLHLSKHNSLGIAKARVAGK